MISKLGRVSDFPRYLRELPDFLRGTARAKTSWGGIMYVPFPEHRCLVEKGYFEGEEEVLEYFDKNIGPNDVFFDIGANAGYYSLLAQFKGAKEIHAFEPFPNTFQLLKKNIEMNGNVVHLHEAAISDHDGFVAMEGEGVSGYNKVSEKGATKVRSMSLDNFPVIPTIVKIDAEYHDLEAVKGMEKMLRTHKPKLMVECDTSMEFLKNLGYKPILLGHPKKRDYAFEM